jgi:hypothetical protein
MNWMKSAYVEMTSSSSAMSGKSATPLARGEEFGSAPDNRFLGLVIGAHLIQDCQGDVEPGLADLFVVA